MLQARLSLMVDYTHAGTVEYLFLEETGEFFFLELNPRLQVTQHTHHVPCTVPHAPCPVPHAPCAVRRVPRRASCRAHEVGRCGRSSTL